MMKDNKRRRIENELGELIVRNMARFMEREREQRSLGKVAFAKYCGITAPSYLTFLDGSANPTIYVITRISKSLNVSVSELIYDNKVH